MNRHRVTSPDVDRGAPRRTAGSRSRALRWLGALGAASALVVLGPAAPASAHVSVEPSTTAAGASATLAFSVGHGCDGSPTTALTIRLPEQINAATPVRHPLWDAEKTTVELDPPVTDAHGNELSERVESVTFTTDEPLPDGVRDTVEVSVQIPESPGTTLVFPVIQRCESGESAWIEVPSAGLSEDDLELPAPSFTVTDALAEDGQGTEGEAAEAGATAAEEDPEPGAAATDEATDEASATSSGSGPLVATALGAGVLGALLGGAALVMQRRSR